MKCYLCPNLCGVDRKYEKGLCGCGEHMVIARAAPHFFEEPPISGTKGSGTVFFAGCTMKCSYCQNYEISRAEGSYKRVTPKELADIFFELEKQGVHNINLVTPTHFSVEIRQALDIYRPKIPVVYNTSGYERAEIIRELSDYVDIYLTDFKYSSDIAAKKYSPTLQGRYLDECLAATEEMLRQKPCVIDENGIMRQGVIIRHLILPGEVENSLDVMKIIAERFLKARISIMSQFTPTKESGSLNRPIRNLEYKIIINSALSHGITDAFVQELSSADSSYIPDWDF